MYGPNELESLLFSIRTQSETLRKEADLILSKVKKAKLTTKERQYLADRIDRCEYYNSQALRTFKRDFKDDYFCNRFN